jgi:hypothetical protein
VRAEPSVCDRSRSNAIQPNAGVRTPAAVRVPSGVVCTASRGMSIVGHEPAGTSAGTSGVIDARR